jgi:hypothetical protein
MAHQPDDYLPEKTDLAGQQGDAPVLQRVQELTWATIDDLASDDDVRLLESLLLSDDEAVNDYVGCVQLHVDLMAEFAPEAAQPGKSALAFLNEKLPPLGMEPLQQ